MRLNCIVLRGEQLLKLARTDQEIEMRSLSKEEIKSMIRNENWDSSSSIEDFENKFKIFLKICEVLSVIPTPVGNPFSLALIGDDLSKGDYTSAAIHLIGGLPWFGLLGKSVSLLRSPKFVSDVIKSCPLILRSVLKPVIIWLGDSIKNLVNAKIVSYSLIIVVRGLLEKVRNVSLVSAARDISDKTGYKSNFLKRYKR